MYALRVERRVNPKFFTDENVLDLDIFSKHMLFALVYSIKYMITERFRLNSDDQMYVFY